MAAEKKSNQTKQNMSKSRQPEEQVKRKNSDGDGVWKILIPAFFLLLAVFILACLVAQAIMGGVAYSGGSKEALIGGLNNFTGRAKDYPLGYIGYGIIWFLTWVFGSSVYFVPFLLGWIGIRWNAFRRHEASFGKIFLAIGAMVFFSAFIQVVTLSTGVATDCLQGWKSHQFLNHGGLLGGLVAWLLFVSIRKIGTWILGIPVLFIFIVFLFNINVPAIISHLKNKHAVSKVKREEKMQKQAAVADGRHMPQQTSKTTSSKEQADEEWIPEEKPSLSYDDDDATEPEPVPVAPAAKRSKEAVFINPDEFFDPIAEVTGNESSKNEPESKKAAPEPEPAVEEEPVQPAKPVVDEKKESDWFTENDEAVANKAFPADRESTFGDSDSEEEKEFNQTFGGTEDEDIFPEEEISPEPEEELEEAEEEKESIPVPEPPKPTPKPQPVAKPAPFIPAVQEIKPYVFPPIDLLAKPVAVAQNSMNEIEENKQIIRETLHSFRIEISGDVSVTRGPTVTRYEFKPAPGVRVNAVINLTDDLALALSAPSIRMEAPVPGKSAIGIEVANKSPETVYLRTLIDAPEFKNHKSKIAACLGQSIDGSVIVFDIKKMPHLLVAGATGMGKSVCINSIIISLLYHATPEEVRLILIDPKTVEFASYADCPLLAVPIITDMQQAAGALRAAVIEMDRRFEEMSNVGVREISAYNAVIKGDPEKKFMPQYVIIIDELADLMMQAGKDVETSICRIAQKARACGIHLILGTQRPSVDVITGLMKSNIPSRIAFTVASQVDSRTIIDMGGAEKLIGRGDMLFAPVGASKPLRVQGSFVGDKEVEDIVQFVIKHNGRAEYNEDLMKSIQDAAASLNKKKAGEDEGEESDEAAGDNKLVAALGVAVEFGKISTSLLQRKIKVGYGRAAGILDRLEELGYISAAEGNKPRQVLITEEQYNEIKEKNDLTEE